MPPGMRSPLLSPAHPTGDGGLDFLSRLALAEARDTHRTERSTVRFHPKVVTGVAPAPEVVRACITSNTMYSEREEEEAIRRMLVKQHLKQCSATADPVTRNKLNAVAADEAWRRADELRGELLDYESTGLGWGRPADLKERQREAVIRCQQQMYGTNKKLPRKQQQQQQQRLPSPTPPLKLNIMQQQPQTPSFRPQATPLKQQQAPSAAPLRASHSLKAVASEPPRPPLQRVSSNGALPGRAIRRESPRPSARPASPRSAPAAGQRALYPRSQSLPGQAVRSSTRVVNPPGGMSSIVFGASPHDFAQEQQHAAAQPQYYDAYGRYFPKGVAGSPVRMQANRVRV